MRRFTVTAGRQFVVLVLAAVLPATRADVPAVTAPRRDPADRVLECTVGIECQADVFSRHTGSGVVISADGHILTATSVVPPGATQIKVAFPGFVPREASLVASDTSLAVSLVKVAAADLPFLPLARGLPEIGCTVFTAGDVEDSMRTNGRASFSRGIVSGIYEVPSGPEADYAGIAIETTAAVNPNSDGGPLVDAGGAVCGVITLGVRPLRWQGTAVPSQVLLERFAPFATGGVVTPASVTVVPNDLRTVAERFAKALVGIEVARRHPPESLPLVSWAEYRRDLEGFDDLSAEQQEVRFAEYIAILRLMEVNQLLRRPAEPLTGVVVSPDGHVLTSLFNVGVDTAFVRKTTGKPPVWNVHDPLAKVLAASQGETEPRPNPVETITVILADGSRRQARLVARHAPLGVALLKIEATGLAAVDLADAAASPQLGDDVGVLGGVPGGRPAWTLNTGIVSAPARNRGFLFQTDALLNYGNSGGPVFDRAGNLLGIAAAPIEPDTILGRIVSMRQLMTWTRAPNSGVGLVARADRIRDALPALMAGTSFDRPPGPFLGIEADEKRAFTAALVIGRVVSGSPAERAGLKAGDKVLELDGLELRGWNDFTDRLSACKPGDRVDLAIQRRSSGPRLVINGRDIETEADLQRLKKSLQPGETFEGTLSSDDVRTVTVELGERR